MKINNIVFYRDDNNQTKAIVFYCDKKVKNISYHDGVELLLRYAKEKGYTKISELKNDENLKIWNNKEYKENIAKLINNKRTRKNPKKNKTKNNETSNNKKHSNPLKNIFSRLKRDKTKKKRKKRKKSILNALIGTLIAACIGTGAWIKRDIDKKQQNIEKELENDSNKNNKTGGEENNYDSIYTALYEANMNADKKKAINSIWKYINDYNLKVSENHISKNSSTKLGLKWNEVVAEYLAYNNLSQQAINNIFDTYKFDSNVFIDAYKSGFNQEVLAHTVQIEPSGKSNIIKSQKGKNFYEKYESIVIYYNSTKGGSQKSKYAEKFYKQLQEDFDFNKSNIKDVEKYKLSIMPMIKAMNQMTSKLDLDNKLSEAEKDYFNKLSSANMIKSKFINIENKLTSYQIANKALGEYQDEISYKKLKNLAIKELKKNNAYQVANNSDRNIKDHKEYKKNVSYEVASNNKKKDVSSTDSKENNNQSNTKEEKTTVIKTKASVKKDKIKTNNTNNTSNTSNVVKQSNNDDEYYYVNPDTKTDNSNEVINDNNNVATSGGIEIDDSVKDITTDGTGAVDTDTPLPDPNNENNNTIEKDDSLITVTYINPKGINTDENYKTSKEDSMTEESVATAVNSSDEISTGAAAKTYTR